jgi:hypothetical protein
MGPDGGHWFLHSPIGVADGSYLAFYRSSYRGPVYGEMTAYAISMACIWYRRSGDERFLERARRSAAYLVKVAQPGVRGPSDGRAYTFDTGIMASGLLDLYAITAEEYYLAEARRRLDWLRSLTKNGSLPATVPEQAGSPLPQDAWSLRRSVHLAKVALPFLKGWRATRDERDRESARHLLTWALSCQSPEGRFYIDPSARASMTHAHCYATEALLHGVWAAPELGLSASLQRAAAWLAQAQNDDGSFYKWYGIDGPGGHILRTKVSDATAQALRIWRVMGAHGDNAARAEAYLRSVAAPDGGLANHVRRLGPIQWRQRRIYAWPTFFWHHALSITFGDAHAAQEIF